MAHVYARCQTDVESAGCGVVEHDDDCLCDVVVKHTSPIDYGLHELPLVMEVARRLEKGWPWTGAAVADVMTMVLSIYDQVHDNFVVKPEGWVPDRDTVVAFHREGGCIMDALDMFAIDFNAWKWVVVGPHSSLSTINMEGWVFIEDKYQGGSATAKQVADEFGVSRQAVSKITNDLGWKTAAALPALNEEQAAEVAVWLSDGESVTTVASRIRTEFDVVMTRAAVSMMRTRLMRRGII